jgi:hypothetical protein
VIGWDTTAVDDYTQKHETKASSDLHYAESEFDLVQLVGGTDWACIITDLSIASNSEKLDDHQSEQQRDDPSTVVNVLYIGPVMDDLADVRLVRAWLGLLLHCKLRRSRRAGQ